VVSFYLGKQESGNQSNLTFYEQGPNRSHQTKGYQTSPREYLQTAEKRLLRFYGSRTRSNSSSYYTNQRRNTTINARTSDANHRSSAENTKKDGKIILFFWHTVKYNYYIEVLSITHAYDKNKSSFGFNANIQHAHSWSRGLMFFHWIRPRILRLIPTTRNQKSLEGYWSRNNGRNR